MTATVGELGVFTARSLEGRSIPASPLPDARHARLPDRDV
ncbi:MAG: hypothetical protein AVDCRST_MAG69-1007 [uncultured Solirubrobacteraceae bacterium]|uniref:Uncharacterized protein n=1 Tax=uncultured Solirubrobacteraceae bacterium TaxID=1162706 RepID=A0A6J4RZ98_9ACTN|nr:MAG: hypothetical protein AVDCRST_MAG69-1007 [uncultured Solirubrobacteraceae bacterium]